ncbi:MAG: alpha/beta hydrolase [Clostridia bacterium]
MKILNYLDIGKGEPLIFLHGWGGSINSFLQLATRLSAKYRCILVDFYGFGQTPLPDYPLNLQDYAEGVTQVLTKLNITKATLIAHSFGGRVAIFLGNQPYVKSIVLIDSAGLKPRRKVKFYIKIFASKICKLFKIKANLGSCDYKKLSEIEKINFKNIVNNHQDKTIKTLKVKTLILWGKCDKDTPLFMAKKLQKTLNANLFIFKKLGHFCYLYEETACINLIDRFLRGDFDGVSGINYI